MVYLCSFTFIMLWKPLIYRYLALWPQENNFIFFPHFPKCSKFPKIYLFLSYYNLHTHLTMFLFLSSSILLLYIRANVYLGYLINVWSPSEKSFSSLLKLEIIMAENVLKETCQWRLVNFVCTSIRHAWASVGRKRHHTQLI